jgi:membrane dipeptidase
MGCGGLALRPAVLADTEDASPLLRTQEVPVSSGAIDLVVGAVVIDMLGLLTIDWLKLFGWQDAPDRFSESDFRELESSRIDIYHPAVETGAANPRAGARRWIEGWQRLVRSRPCFLRVIAGTRDLDRAPGGGALGVIVGFQNSEHFAKVADVADFHGMGQRVSQLTYNGPNRLGSGCLSRRDTGLTAFGADIVGEMNRVGMAIDVSHCGERTSLDAIAASRSPVLATHSNCGALVPGQPRCKSDQVIRRLAAGGGVLGLTIVPAFLRAGGRASIEDVLNHFEHVIRLVGVEHVGLGSDVSGDAARSQHLATRRRYQVRDLDPSLRAFQIADGLLRRGYARADIELVLGGNFRRVLHEIWQASPSAAGSDDVRSSRRDPFCPAPAPPPSIARLAAGRHS